MIFFIPNTIFFSSFIHATFPPFCNSFLRPFPLITRSLARSLSLFSFCFFFLPALVTQSFLPSFQPSHPISPLSRLSILPQVNALSQLVLLFTFIFHGLRGLRLVSFVRLHLSRRRARSCFSLVWSGLGLRASKRRG